MGYFSRTIGWLTLFVLLYMICANVVRVAIPDYLPSTPLTRSIATSASSESIWLIWVCLGGWVIGRMYDLYGSGTGFFATRPAWRIIIEVFASYILAIAMFAIAYFDLSVAAPEEAFNKQLTVTSAFYFSVVAITTTGFGDIFPKSDIAMVYVSLELLFGFGYTVLFFSILAALALRGREDRM